MIPYVECDAKAPGGRPGLCASLGVKVYPTWVIGSERIEGVVPIDRLAEISRFPKPERR